jgi:uncharacterized iron-regulated protein
MTPRALAVFVPLCSLACAPRFDPRLVAQPIAGRDWVSTLDRDHPLVGRIWDARGRRFADEAALAAAVAGADFVLLGEIHDNPDHHLLQARLVRTAAAGGRAPALAFEMLTSEQQPAVDEALAGRPRDAKALADVWRAGGWPGFEQYAPIFQAGLDAGLPIVAANLPRRVVKEIVSRGAEALDEPIRVRLARDEPLPPAVLEELRAEMRESHCGALPESVIDPLVLAQRARDAQMAARLASAERGVLVAGRGHVRADRGVPVYLETAAPGRRTVVVAFMEVVPGRTDPAAYGEGEAAQRLQPYDWVVFTPGAKREDPCEGMRRHPRRERKAEPGGDTKASSS